MISLEAIRNLAELARLKLTASEEESLQRDISNILEYVEAVSTAKIPSASSARGEGGIVLRNVMRTDVARGVDDALAGREEALRAALPKSRDGYNVVRKIIQKDE
jgi:aspartyl/glutamyl-tRNA(Asn/Gln) amidotransferase C subunit